MPLSTVNEEARRQLGERFRIEAVACEESEELASLGRTQGIARIGNIRLVDVGRAFFKVLDRYVVNLSYDT